MEIEHRPGAKHGNADALSRLVTPAGDVCKQCEMPWEYEYGGPSKSEVKEMKEKEENNSVDMLSDESDTDSLEGSYGVQSGPVRSHLEGGPDGHVSGTPGEVPILRRGRKPNRPKPTAPKKIPDIDLGDLDFIRKMQEEDDTIGEILKLKNEDVDKPTWEDISSKSREFKFYAAKWELLSVKNNVLCRFWEEPGSKPRWKICAPTAILNAVLYYLHDARSAGHQGIKKTFEKAKLSPFFWRNMQKTVKDYVNMCEICGERKNPPFKKRHNLKSYLVGAPFERIATDIAGPFPPTENGNRYILVVGDYFTKLTEAYPIPDIQAITVANTIFRAWIKRYGCPKELHSDQGRQYESQIFQELCKFLDIKKTRTTPLHPRSDGMIERMNKTINNMLSKYIKSHQKDWDDYLDSVIMVYNTTPHESTGITPHRMVFGDEMRFPLDLITEKLEDDQEAEGRFATEYVMELEENLRKIHQLAREHLGQAAERQKSAYDGQVRSRSYNVGDLVWRNQKKNVPGRKPKIARNWTGPWIIVDKLSDIVFKIQFSKKSTPAIVHGDNLKPYLGQKKFTWFTSENWPRRKNFDTAEFPTLNDYVRNNDDSDESQADENIPTVSHPNFDPDILNPEDGNYQDPDGNLPESGVREHAEGYETPEMRNEDAHCDENKNKSYCQKEKRKTRRPRRLEDYIVGSLEITIMECQFCSKRYASKKGLKRHFQEIHQENCRVVRCPQPGCRRTFFRRENLATHLRSTHGQGTAQSKERARVVYFQYVRRTDLNNSESSDESQNEEPESDSDSESEDEPGQGVKRGIINVSSSDDENNNNKTRKVSLDGSSCSVSVTVENAHAQDNNSSANSHSDEMTERVEVVEEIDEDTEMSEDHIYYSDDEAGPSTSQDQRYHRSEERQCGTVEIINLALITKRVKDKDGNETVIREQKCSATTQIDINSCDWVDYINYWEAEIYRHVEGMRRQETGSVRVVEIIDSEEEDEDMGDEEM